MGQSSYLAEVHSNLPRLLSLIDEDASSKSYGIADRYYWAWGLIDFGNATFQGMAHGLARLWCQGLWPYKTTQERFLRRIDALYMGTARVTRPDGSLEEAFPNEGSYCVTALVAFDLLVTLDLLEDQVSMQMKQRWQQIIQPLVGYLIRADESHAIISNHLATAVAALVRWHRLTGDEASEARARQLMNRILEHQSAEGWFLEYQGADPGYQSLCTYYLADVHRLRPDWKLQEALQKSIAFLWHFAHPDGSFGGLYGSRCTRFYYPAGLLALASDIPEAAALAAFMEQSIRAQQVVALSSIDEPNLVPMFNSYCWAATLAAQGSEPIQREGYPLPSLGEPFVARYPEAGLVVQRGQEHYTVISLAKGGVICHHASGTLPLINAGVVVASPGGQLGTNSMTKSVEYDEANNAYVITAAIVPMPKQLPRPWQFLILRTLSITLFGFPVIREWVKRVLVRMLITGGRPWPVTNRRTIKLGRDLQVQDQLCAAPGYEMVNGIASFVPIHMASQGYWQVQDEEQL